MPKVAVRVLEEIVVVEALEVKAPEPEALVQEAPDQVDQVALEQVGPDMGVNLSMAKVARARVAVAVRKTGQQVA